MPEWSWKKHIEMLTKNSLKKTHYKKYSSWNLVQHKHLNIINSNYL